VSIGQILLSQVSLGNDVTTKGYSSVFHIVDFKPCSASAQEVLQHRMQPAKSCVFPLSLERCASCIPVGTMKDLVG